MKSSLAFVAVLAAIAFVACGDDDASDNAAEPPPAETAAEADGTSAQNDGTEPDAQKRDDKAPKPKPGTEITVADSQFGEIVFNADNQAIYLFDKESSSKSECYGACAEAWPPVLTEGEPVAAGAAEQKLLGTTERDDGSTQVTYAGQPLYYYAHEGPGQVLCHNVSEFGGAWLVLGADGQALS